jgi:hypothetical protein
MTSQPDSPVVIPEDQKLAMQLEAIFMPFATQERRQLYEPRNFQSAKFVHYTTAEAALNIINSKRLWMRNATCMADYREVQHGFDVLKRFFADDAKRSEFAAALDACHDGATMEAIKLFDHWWGDLQSQTSSRRFRCTMTKRKMRMCGSLCGVLSVAPIQGWRLSCERRGTPAQPGH